MTRPKSRTAALDILFQQAEQKIAREPKAKAKKRKLAVIDFETDPFKFGRVPEPFCCEFYSDDETVVFWGDDCHEQLARFLEAKEDPYLIYAHNGGKFDFHFLLRYVDNPARIIKTRIVEARIFHHTLRDSFAILPVPLKDYEKMEFDYSKMERPVREKNRDNILEYLHSDCVHLYTLVKAFIDRFGNSMTIGGAAIRELRKLHPFKSGGANHDKALRPYYYGGRVQVFKHGIIKGPVKLIDVNSSYPAGMRNYRHPINGMFHAQTTLPDSFDDPYFITFTGSNHNALPSVADNGELIFTRKHGTFRACSHEIKIALEHDLIKIEDIHEVLISTQHTSFAEYVDLNYADKAEAKAAANKTGEMFAKLLLNTPYGRMGINPENFADWFIHRDFGGENDLREKGYAQACDYEHMELWSKPVDIANEHYCDVAIAASITSASRSILLEGLQKSVDPFYCDTDSIICRDFNGDVDKYRIGAWDLEKTSDKLAIAGKKMYALYSDDALAQFDKPTKSNTSFLCGKCKLAFSDPIKHRSHQLACSVKLSSKGGSLNLSEIVRICEGEVIHYENDAPTFSLRKKPSFVHRNFRQTVDLTETGL